MDIRKQITKVLEDGSEMTGVFSYFHKHYDAPNPGLSVEGAGSIGLPLGPRDVEAIKAVAVPAGQDKHLWDVSAENVSFENAKWSAFMNDTLHKVCDGLGIHEERYKTRLELVKLRLSETGASSLMASADTKASNLVATLAVILPSKFTGGEIRVKHGDDLETHDCTPASIMENAVVAWHRDTTHEVRPLTEGYCLTLHYDVLSCPGHHIPTLAAQDGVLASLGQVLSSWNQAAQDHSAQNKIVYLLENTYSRDDLTSSVLTGPDARTISLVNAVSRRHDIRLGLATLKENIEGFDDLMDIETDIKLQHLVGFDGRPIHTSLKFNLEKEAIPVDLETWVKSGQPNKRMIGFVDVDELRLRQVYYRTVLVIWPQWSELGNSGLGAHDAEPPAKRRRTELN